MAATASPGGQDTPCKMIAGTRLSMAQRLALLSTAWNAVNVETLDTINILVKLLAISQAESSGYTHACNTNANGTRDYGFMQINQINGGSPATSNIPATCAAQAITVYNRQGFKAWSAYGGVRYLAALPAAKLAAAKITSQAQVGGQAGIAGAEAAKNNESCVYGWTTPGFGVGAGKFICFDTILGGLKMAAGAFGAGISGLALLVVVARNVPGAGEAQSATRRVTSRLPAPAPVKAYRTVSGERGRREELRARARRSDEQARGRATLASSAEQRRQDESAARVERLRRPTREPRTRTQTVYVTDSDPMYDTMQKRARQQRAHRDAERAEATRRHGDPDAPPF